MVERTKRMSLVLLWASVAATTCLISAYSATRVSHEYCNMEQFNATCREDEVIVVESARYGRMNIGRCMTSTYGHHGCSTDVHRFLDAKCSGRQVCRFQVPDPDLYRMNQCPTDFTSYLEATYSCIPVSVGERHSCDPGIPLRVFNSSGFLSTTVAEERGYGHPHCPWVIEALPGQRINLTLYNFATPPGAGDPADQGDSGSYGPPRSDVCFGVAEVTDGVEGKRTITVCGGDARETPILLTKSNVARVEIPNPKLLQTIGAFLIRYKVVGCPDLKLAADAWYQKTSDTMVVRCNVTAQVWHLVCKGTRWIGDIGNCSTTSAANVDRWSLEQMFTADDSFPVGVLIAVSLGVAMGVIIGGTLLCVITLYMRRQRRNFQGYTQPKEQHVCTTFQTGTPSQHLTTVNWLMDTESVVLQDPDLHRTSSCRIAAPTSGAGLPVGVSALSGGDCVVDYSSFDSTRPCYVSQFSSPSRGFKPKPHFYESPCL